MKNTIIKTRPRAFYKRNKGFTLVEILVSAVIVMLCIVVIVAMLRKGREIDINDRYRRLAKAVITAEFETPKLHYSNWDDLHDNYLNTTTVLNDVIIDKRGAESDITGDLTTTIGNTDNIAGVVYIPVTINLSWQTVEGNDAITLTKRITGAK